MHGNGMTAPRPRDYLIGLFLALVLTAVPFGLVHFKVLSGRAMFLAIAAAAIAQVVVHLRYFLHLRLSETPRENLLALAFAAMLIFIMVGGSLWIMFDLHHRMAMPAGH
jgi:cytochrome o ubiquinol oxidase operon protein cyoD